MGYRLAEWIGEPFLEILLTAKYLRHQEMHKRPELHDIVLEGGPRQEESSLCVKAQERLPPLTLEVLNVLSFIQDHVVPLLPSECKVILNDKFVGGDAHVERVLSTPSMTLKLAFFLRSEVGENFEGRAPLLKFHFPIDDDCSWYHDQMRTPYASITG